MLAIMGETNGDNTVFTVSNAGDINGDTIDDFIIGGSGNTYGSAYLIYGSSAFPSIDIDFKNYLFDSSTAATIILANAYSDGFGSTLSDIGDINGDGKNDFMIGAPRKQSGRGAMYVIYGGTTLSNINLATNLNPSTTGFSITDAGVASTGGDTSDDRLGCSISNAGKLNGDSYADIVVGISGKNSNTGAVLVIYGGSSRSDITVTGSAGVIDPSNAGFIIYGEASNDYFGCSVSTAGDVNGDTHDDIIIGAKGKSSNRGAAYVIYGRPDLTFSTMDLSSLTLNPTTTGFRILGNAANDLFGCSVSAAGDVNGDGIDDIIVGACGKDGSKGAAYIIYGSLTPSEIDLSSQTLVPAATGFVVSGKAAGDQLGYSVKNVGDLNHDGYDEVMIGASGQGAVHVILGGDSLQNSDLSSGDLDPTKNGFTLSENSGVEFGLSVSSGDFNGDGKTELFVATSGYGTTGSIEAGYVFYLSSKRTFR